MKNEPALKLALSMHAKPGAYALLIGSGVSKSAGIPTGWEIVRDRTGLEQGSEWGLLKAGFFNGSIERFKEVVEIHKKLLQNQANRWNI